MSCGAESMECTVTLDEKLLDEARRLLGTETVEDTLEASLRTAIEAIRVRREREAHFGAFLDHVELDMTDEDLHQLRYAELERLNRLEAEIGELEEGEHPE